MFPQSEQFKSLSELEQKMACEVPGRALEKNGFCWIERGETSLLIQKVNNNCYRACSGISRNTLAVMLSAPVC